MAWQDGTVVETAKSEIHRCNYQKGNSGWALNHNWHTKTQEICLNETALRGRFICAERPLLDKSVGRDCRSGMSEPAAFSPFASHQGMTVVGPNPVLHQVLI